jgi:hypothetical protein
MAVFRQIHPRGAQELRTAGFSAAHILRSERRALSEKWHWANIQKETSKASPVGFYHSCPQRGTSLSSRSDLVLNEERFNESKRA